MCVCLACGRVVVWWEEHGFASRTVARGHYKAMYRHEWAMNHCREKAERLLLNIQHALPEHGMSQAAQQQARRCCSKASKNFRPSVGARARKSARGAAQVAVGRGECPHTPPALFIGLFSSVYYR